MADLLKKIYNDPLDADIQIHLKSGEIIHAHGVVLKNRSQVIRAMLSDVWSVSHGQLRFTHSDSAVAYVLRVIYMVDLKPPTNVYKVIKFAHYLQLDAVLERMCKQLDNKLPRNQAIKIAQLLEYHNTVACSDCVRRTLSTDNLTTGVRIIYDVACNIRPDTYAWFMDRLLTTPHAPHYPIILTIFYGARHGLHDLIIAAIKHINVDDHRIKLHMVNAVANEQFPAEYIQAVAAVFVPHSRLVDTCGCTDCNTMHTCPDCAYKFCSGCDMRFGCIAHGALDPYYCPRCGFRIVTQTDNPICLGCAKREFRVRTITYCVSHHTITLHPDQHVQCDSLSNPDTAWHKFLEIYGDDIANKQRRRLDHVIWRLSKELNADV